MLVDIGALLPVHLHRDEVLIKQVGDRFVLEGLPLHHMAPVAAAVADAEKDRLVFPSGLLERLLPPGVPIHGIVGVLLEVGRVFIDQSVGHDFPLLVFR